MHCFALLRAAVHNHLDIARWLITELCVDVNDMPLEWGDTEISPLILAVDAGHVEMVQLLLQLGANTLKEDHLALNSQDIISNL